MGGEVPTQRCIRTFFVTTTNRHDLQRAVPLEPLLELVNGL